MDKTFWTYSTSSSELEEEESPCWLLSASGLDKIIHEFSAILLLRTYFLCNSVSTICPRSLEIFWTVSYYINWTSETYSIYLKEEIRQKYTEKKIWASLMHNFTLYLWSTGAVKTNISRIRTSALFKNYSERL